MNDLRAAARLGLRALIDATGREQVSIGGRTFQALVSPADEEAKAMAGLQVHERGLVIRIDYDDLGGQLIGLKESVYARSEDWRIVGLFPSTVGVKLTLKAAKN